MVLATTAESRPLPRSVGRYLLYDEIAAGGMATVHVGRLLGPAGFSRTVAVKRLHPQFAKDPEFVSMFLDEARLAARIRHPNVVSTLDVVARGGELFLVMEYVQGLSLSRLLAAMRHCGQTMPPKVASAIVGDTLLGLHAAHEAKGDRGEPLGIVHRDISPQNIMVGADGIARVVDFGVAKAASRVQTTREGQIKGKIAYMSPEQLQSHPVDNRSDVFAASVVLWEVLTGRRLFAASDAGGTVANILWNPVEPPSKLAAGVGSELDQVALRGLSRAANERFGSAREMARALERALPRAGALEVADWVAQVAGDLLQASADRLAVIEEASAEVDVGRQSTLPSIRPMSAVTEDAASAARSSSARADFRRDEAGNDETLPEVTDLSAARASPLLSVSPWRSAKAMGIFAAALTVTIIAIGALALGRDISGLPTYPPPSLVASPGEPSSSALIQAAVPPAQMKPSDAPVISASSLPTSVAASAPPKPSGAKTPPRTTAPKAKHRPSLAAAARGACDPPFTLKPDGSKRFKPECF